MPTVSEHRTYTARFLSHALQAVSMRTFRVRWEGTSVQIEIPCRTPEEARQMVDEIINTPYHVDRRSDGEKEPT